MGLRLPSRGGRRGSAKPFCARPFRGLEEEKRERGFRSASSLKELAQNGFARTDALIIYIILSFTDQNRQDSYLSDIYHHSLSF